MLRTIVAAIARGIQRIRDNPQLIFTLFVALVIFFSFVFITQRFASIAQEAQDRLINVRIGSLQDAFVELIGDIVDDPITLNKKIKSIADNNETIQEFRVIDSTSGERKVLGSLQDFEVGNPITDPNEQLYQFAESNPDNSFTVALIRGGNRFFETARAITDASSTPIAVVVTRQSLSEADKVINDSINSSIIIFICVIALVMLLFFRHSRIIDYTVLYQKLREVDGLKDDFIAMASHELRTPLTIIRGYAELIRDAQGLDQETKKYTLSIDTASKQLDELVTEILDVSRIEQGRMNFDMKVTNPSPIIHDVVESLKHIAEEKNLTLAFEGISYPILIDQQRLRQVLINIIGNAIKYTKAGGVKVTSVIVNNKFEIRVSDTGIGIGADEKEHLFEKFYRIRNDETKDISGTGLGLWITAEIVTRMNGIIHVESIKGKGTDFIVSFPVVKQ